MNGIFSSINTLYPVCTELSLLSHSQQQPQKLSLKELLHISDSIHNISIPYRIRWGFEMAVTRYEIENYAQVSTLQADNPTHFVFMLHA